MDEGRKADLKELKKIRATAPDKATLANVKRVEASIKDEQHDGYLRSARKRMLHEAKKGRMQSAHDVQQDLLKHKDRNMGIGATRFSLNLTQERYDEIFGHNIQN